MSEAAAATSHILPASGVPTAISADLLAPPSRGLNLLMQTLIGLVAVFVLWAMFASLQEVTSAQGRVVPATKIQVVQNLEGGIVREVLVREGAMVREGDIILRIDPTIAGSTLGEAREKQLGLQMMVARLEAEVENKQLAVPGELASQRPDLLAEQRNIFEARKAELDAALSALELQEKQRGQEVVELEAKITTSKKSLALAQEELTLMRPLALTKAVSRTELLAIESKVNDLDGSMTAAELALPRIRSAIQEARDRRQEKISAFRSEALQKLSAARVELAALSEASRSSEDKLERTTVRAPVAGIVKTVHVTTPGQVVQPGRDLIEIVPLNDTLLVEAQVRPQDIAFVRPGQEAVVKLTAYDFSIYGGLKGVVDRIGADSVTTEKGETYYVIRVRTDKSTLAYKGAALPIIPGMVANVDVITGSKTVLAYLTKPLTKLRHEAMRER
ncbi:MAG: HlyD family type I secretion periplasmic adaptor subunit [Hyphomicrobium sp.]